MIVGGIQRVHCLKCNLTDNMLARGVFFGSQPSLLNTVLLFHEPLTRLSFRMGMRQPQFSGGMTIIIIAANEVAYRML